MVVEIMLFVAGAAMGSFSLVLAWRMHDKKDWVRGRSACEKCGHKLSGIDMLPVISWLALRGKCRYCSKPFSRQLLYAELLLGLLYLTSFIFWPYELSSITEQVVFAVWLLSLVIMSALFWYDMRWFILPNKLVYSLLVCSIVFVTINAVVLDTDVVFSSLMAAGALSGFFFLLYHVSSGAWIGYGDVRLALSLGLFSGGLLEVWLLVFLASVIGLVFAAPGMVSGNRSLASKIPFGPMLIIATVLVVLFDQYILDTYLLQLTL